jgi:hypothetical protein
MNDDFFIIQPVNIKEIAPLYKNDLKDWPASYWNNHSWRQRMFRTFKVLQAAGLGTLCFDIHAPMPLERERVQELAERFDYLEGIGLNWRSLYGNVNYANDAVRNGGRKIAFYAPTSAREITRKIKGRTFMAVAEKGLNDDMKRMLDYYFRKRCKFERC